jgi:hypothetical protein
VIKATCLGNWDSEQDHAAPVWLSVGRSYPVLQIIIGTVSETLVRIPSGELDTPGLWPARYFEFDSSSENWIAQANDGQLSISPRELGHIDWFSFFDEPDNDSKAILLKYIRSS